MVHYAAIKVLKAHSEKLKAALNEEETKILTSQTKEEIFFASSTAQNIREEINKITESIEVLLNIKKCK